jgi:diphthamide biosynthesis enzyme Dph1/Dph2-like protein
MKILFIEAKKKNLKLDNSNLNDLPKKIHLLFSIQYKELAEILRGELKNQGKKIEGFNQVLGCSEIKLKGTPLLVGSGKFHAIQLSKNTNKEILIYNSGKIKKVKKEEIEKFRNRNKAKFKKFLKNKDIGVIISEKPGQKIKKLKLEKFKKNFHFFLTSNINIGDLENYPIEIWINTACPGLELDSKKILNYKTLKKFIKK